MKLTNPKTIARAICLIPVLLAVFAGCGGPEKKTAEIDVEAAQAGYDDWASKRIAQVESDPSLSDAEKKKQIEEIKKTAEGQMAQVKGLAEGQGDERGQGR